jgi:hypothetical protein
MQTEFRTILWRRGIEHDAVRLILYDCGYGLGAREGYCD